MNPAAEAKIRMINNSLRCFVFGLLGLLPAIGLPFAIAALVVSGKARADRKNCWNAADAYRKWGVAFASIGAIFWCCILVILLCAIASG